MDRQAAGVFLLHEWAAQAARQYHAPLEAAEVFSAVEGERCRVYGSKAARWWAAEGVEIHPKRQNETADAVKSCVRYIHMLFPFCNTTVLTSATISDKTIGAAREKCGYFLDTLGYHVIGHVSEPKVSPFGYESNTILYVSNKLPYPNLSNRKIYREQSIAEILRLLSVTHGKTLILFTAKEDMEYVYKKLVNLHLPYRIIVQGKSSSQAMRLKSGMKKTLT